MKSVKRIIAVVLLLLTVILVGYLIYTGSRFSLPDGAMESANTIKEAILWKNA